MAIKINFDSSKNIILPTFVLAKRNGEKICTLPLDSINFKGAMNSYDEFSCTLNQFNNNKKFEYWDEVKDFRLIWCREWDIWFEISVELVDSDSPKKSIMAKSLGESETSQIMLYGVEVNTEADTNREDYEQTILYNQENPKASLLDRILEKAPHYSIKRVSNTIAKLPRTFSFDDKSLYDSMQEIAEEIGCLFIFDSGSNDDGSIKREISVFDLKSNCENEECGYRGEFTGNCPKCGSAEVDYGYGTDTSICVSKENLTDTINYSTNVESVKNCFKLEAGDDLMTATVINCNPTGSAYLWYISDELKNEMSQVLRDKINEYEESVEQYTNTHIFNANVDAYNTLVEKYKNYNPDLKAVSEIVGYDNSTEVYYDTIDFEIYLSDKLMPSAKLDDTDAESQIALIKTELANFPVAVADLNSISVYTASNAVLSAAKAIADSRYKISIDDGATLSENKETWQGKIIVTSYSDEEDVATSDLITITITEDYQECIKQEIEKILSKSKDDVYGIVSIFDKDKDAFREELHKYCLSSLNIFLNSCQACIDILIKQGVSSSESDLYDSLYTPYYNKLISIQEEILVRENEINVVRELQTAISKERTSIQKELSIENYLGEDLWKELVTHRRESTYSNENYSSVGLDNARIIYKANEFLKKAKEEIFKSATLQHTISASLNNLLVIKEFEPIVEHFEVGNWIRIVINGDVYKLRLLSYEINFNNPEKLNVEFSDVTKIQNGITDLESIINNAKSIASSYDYTVHQAEQGAKGNSLLSGWVENGLDATLTKIVNNADNQNITLDSNGLLCREYSDITDAYDDEQLKIINKGLYITNDNWKTAKAGIGNIIYYDPADGTQKHAYGVNAEALVGKLILGEQLGIYNENNSFVIDNNGMIVTTNGEGQNTFLIRKENVKDGKTSYENLFSVDENGDLNIKGHITATSLTVENNDGETTQGTTIEDLISDEIEKILGDGVDQLDGKISTYYQEDAPENPDNGDLWYCTKTSNSYFAGKLYRYDKTNNIWNSIEDGDIDDLRDLVSQKITIFTTENVPQVGEYKTGDRWITNQQEYQCIDTTKGTIADWLLLSPVRENLLIATSSPDLDGNFKKYLYLNGEDVQSVKCPKMGTVFSLTSKDRYSGLYTSYVDIVAGEEYTFSCLVSMPGNTTKTLKETVAVRIYYRLKGYSNNVDIPLNTDSIKLSGDYQLITGQFKPPVGLIGEYYIQIAKKIDSSFAEETILITNIKLERGNCASLYSVNPSDPTAQYQSLKNNNVLMVGDNGALLGKFAPNLEISDTIDPDGYRTVKGVNDKGGSFTFKVPDDGLIIADNAVVRGTIIATNGIFEGTVRATKFETVGCTIPQSSVDGLEGKLGKIDSLEYQMGDIIDDLKQIDGFIQTWYQDTDPSNNWTVSEYAEHEGDIWVNTGSASIDTWQWEADASASNGYAWKSISSDYLTNLAKSKAKIFTGSIPPTPPYSVGDLWVQGSGGDILYCVRYRNKNEGYNVSDWAKSSKYTDDSALDAFKESYEETLGSIKGQLDQKAETWYQVADPSSQWTTPDLKKLHVGDLWHYTGEDATINGVNMGSHSEWIWQLDDTTYKWCEMSVPDEVFDRIDGVASIYVTMPDNPVVGDLLIPAEDINVGGALYKAGKVYRYNNGAWGSISYTDDTSLYNFISGQYTNDLKSIRSQIDGKAETWYQSTDPSEDWNTTELKELHIGDLWHYTGETAMVNGVERTKGSEWVWQKADGKYQWVKMEVSDEVFDAIDGKSSIYVDISDITIQEKGDLLIPSDNQSSNGYEFKKGKIYRCTATKDTFTPADWKEVAYTDDSALDAFKESYEETLDSITGQLDQKAETWYQSTDPSSQWATPDLKKLHVGDLWHYTGESNSVTINGVKIGAHSEWIWQLDGNAYKWHEMSVPDEVFDKIDSVASIYVTLPTNPVVGDLLIPTSDIGTSYKAGKVYRYNGTTWTEISYTDDTKADQAYGLAETAELIGNSLVEGLGFTEITGSYVISPVIAGGTLLIGDTNGVYAQIDDKGKLSCNGADITGKITATSLELKDCTIPQGKVDGLEEALDSKVSEDYVSNYVEDYVGTQLDGKISTYSQDSPPSNPDNGDLWYCTKTNGSYTNGKLYRYNGSIWVLIDDKELEKLVKEKITIFTTDSLPTGYKIGDRWVTKQFEYECISTDNGSMLDWLVISPIRDNLLIMSSSPDANGNFKKYLVSNGGNVQYRKSSSMGSTFMITASDSEKYFYTARADVKGDTDYVFSFLAGTAGGTTNAPNVLDVYYGYSSKTTNDFSYTDASGTLSQNECILERTTLTNTYKLITIKFHTPTNAKSIFFRIDNNGTGSSSSYTISVTNLKLEKGDCASLYSVCPTDAIVRYEALKNGHVLMIGDNGALLGDFASNLQISNVDSNGNRTITTTMDGQNYSFEVSDLGLLVADNAVVKGTIIATNGIFTGEVRANAGNFGGLHIGKDENGLSFLKTDDEKIKICTAARFMDVIPVGNVFECYGFGITTLMGVPAVTFGYGISTIITGDHFNIYPSGFPSDEGIVQGGYLRQNWYTGDSVSVVSDKNAKNSINAIDDRYSLFFDELSPSAYKYNHGTSNRFHVGFISQDVEEALNKTGLTTQDFGGVVITNEHEFDENGNKICDENGNEIKTQKYYLRYEEFIALNTNEIQKLKRRVAELENIVKTLKGE